MIEYIIKIKKKTKNILTDPWVWKMAWRDARHNVSRLMLFTASLVTGITAVVSIGSLNYSLQNDLDRNAKELLGADLVANASKKFEPAVLAVFDSTKLEQASESEMASMVYFSHSRQSRLIRLVALEGNFPFYGKIETIPEDTYAKVKTGGWAMLDESLASQYEVSTNDSLKVGNSWFKVAGVVRRFPGGTGILSSFTPSVYISHAELDSTGLIQYGSRVTYKRFFKTSSDEVTEAQQKSLRPLLRKYGHWLETVETRKEDLGRDFKSVYRFFSLLAFVALILGCIGVASSVHIYAREKREEVAVLRCVGTSGWQAFNIYFIQVAILGLLGSIVGAALGVGVQQVVPFVFADFVPVELQFGISWGAVTEGLLLGITVSILFTVLPLISVRFVPPLTVLRADFEPGRVFSRSRIVVISLIVLFPILSAAYQTGSILYGLSFAGGIIAALGFLALVAIGILFLAKRFFPSKASFVLRHALSNLFRPNNQTQALLVTIGLGAFIIATLNIIQNSLLDQVAFTGNENQSNTILFDIQPSQKEGVVDLMKEQKLPVNQLVPIVTCRLAQVKGKTIDSLQRDTSDNIPNWALTREYRVTYRDSLHHSEELIKGELHHLKKNQIDSVWVTISEGMQESLEVDLGDSVVFDVQGVPIQARIAGIRKVEWPKDPPNFIFVFPTGVLEAAPQIWVATTRIDDQQASNRFQQELVMKYSNVSLIDLRLVLSTINELFGKVSLIIRFLALFSIITGLVVLAGAVMNSKFVRIRENALLRTIGARTKQIVRITLIEYAYLGVFSALTGIVLSFISGFLLTRFFFDVGFSADYIQLLFIGVGVTLLTVVIGWWNSREVITTPPLQVLRRES
ncbi:MAG TPA: FtsX-like permease family protein [Cyclobacteriaceae bacterium]|nr:FtsX-like permease family protein [Cyclobacteriaceae bacterium]